MLARAQEDIVPHRLLAIRHAGARFGDGETLRNEPFEEMLQERDRLLAALKSLKGPLVDALFEIVPTLTEPKARRRLLKLKRNIFNERPLGPLPAELPVALVSEVERYGELLDRSLSLVDSHRPAVMASSRARLAVLVQDSTFLSGLASASSDLSSEIRRDSSIAEQRSAKKSFSNTERALYSYASRFFSKANPFHIFASVQLPGAAQSRRHEISLEPEGMIALERRVLNNEISPSHIQLCLPPLARHGERCLFWQTSADGLKVRSFAWSDGLESVIQYFRTQNRTQVHETEGNKTRGNKTQLEWQRYLESLAPDHRKHAETVIEQLQEQGLLARYVVTDFSDLTSLSEAASKADIESKQLVALAHHHHLSRVNTEDLRRAEQTLQAVPAENRIRHFVNSYRDDDPSPYFEAAESVAEDLNELKPIFAAHGHNFSLNDTVLRAYFQDYLGKRDQAAPYLEVLTHFLGHKKDILYRYQPTRNDRLSLDHQRKQSWRDRLSALDGRIDTKTLGELVDCRPMGRPMDLSEGSLCFNGPFDFQTGLYTVSNIFGGHGHFSSRYHLGRSQDLQQRSGDWREPKAILDVELAVPPLPNLNFVVPAFVTATGMEARYRHRYEHWIEPTDIELVLASDRNGRDSVIYRQVSTGRTLKFHYRGFMLSEFLPAEYQLLLLGHGDTYGNPFLRSEGRPGPGDLRHDSELRFGQIRLRRECWALSFDLLKTAPKEDDPLRFAMQFRDWLHSTLDVAADRWFYRTLGGNEGSYKPRYLDLLNPLGAQAFRRSLLRLPKTAALSFTAMDPLPEHLLDGRMRELMIEV